MALAGAAFGLAANKVSPLGLDLTRNYFPGGARQTVSPPRPAPGPAAIASTNEDYGAAEIEQRLKDKGLQPMDAAQAERLYRDARYEEGLVVFVDARGEEEYRAGHVPGAYRLDPYHPEKEMSRVLGPCNLAAQVVVYCTGGECEDADTTAILLRDAGIPKERLFVYGGGFTEWTERHLPVEQGAGKSAASPGEHK